MKELGEQKFKAIIDRQSKTFFKKFNKDIKNDTSPLEFAREERVRVDDDISRLHRSSDELNGDFFNVHNIKGRKKNLTYPKVIDRYCKELNKDQKAIFDFTANVIGLYKIRDRLDKMIIEGEEALKANTKKGKTDFTTARKVIAFSLLMNDFFDNSSIPDKTKVAKFLDSLISNRLPKENVAYSNLYDRVKELFFNLQKKAKIQDLEYVKTKFEELGMMSLVTKIDSLITEKKQKKQ